MILLTYEVKKFLFSIWTSGDLEKGTRFVPWKGTVRSDTLPVHDKLPEFDVSTT